MEIGKELAQPTGMMQVASNREVQQVQAAAILAQKFPRDVVKAYNSVMRACQLPALAEKAIYEFPRGGAQVRGPSIRLAEAIARSWGNIDFGFQELETKPSIGNTPGESVIMSYCWDLETNTRSSKVFTVRHKRDSKKGTTVLKDERDVYEAVANYSMRRVRSNVLAIIPQEIIEDAMTECEKTMAKSKEPLKDRLVKMIAGFESIDVTKEMLEKRLRHKVEVTSETELVRLRSIFMSIKDGMASMEEFFEIPKTDVSAIVKDPTPAPATEPQVAATTAPTSKVTSIKNFAPQTQEQAQNWEPGQTFGESAIKEVTPAPAPIRRDAVIRDIMTACQKAGMKNGDTQKLCRDTFGKASGELNDAELLQFRDLCVSKIQKEGEKK